jgi:hypothetical protein
LNHFLQRQGVELVWVSIYLVSYAKQIKQG